MFLLFVVVLHKYVVVFLTHLFMLIAYTLMLIVFPFMFIIFTLVHQKLFTVFKREGFKMVTLFVMI